MSLHRVVYCAIILFLLAFGIYSCQKEPNAKLDDTKDISSKDPDALSSAIKVWHGLRTQGTPPAEKGTSLQLDNSNDDPLYAIAGRYAIIQPEVVSGEVAGYYFKVNGAPDYFKVDYTKPRNTGRVIKPKKTNSFFRLDSAGGILDSAIVVVLPANLRVPDTICATYRAYDSAGNISNPIEVCIIVNSIGPDANGTWLNGRWRVTSHWWDSSPHDTVIYNRWSTGDYDWAYNCNNGVLEYVSKVPGQSYFVCDSSFNRKWDLTFGSNGGLNYEYDASWKGIAMTSSTCSNLSFDVQNDTEALNGAWSYNSTTRKMVIVFEFDDGGLPVQDAGEFQVVQLSNKSFLWLDNSFSTAYYFRFDKM